MRRFLFSFIGPLTLIFLPVPALHAQTPVPTPVSQHYVQKVLDRIDRGMENLPGGTDSLELTFYDWLATLSTAMLEMVDTKLHITEQQRNLLRMTPCLHLDLIIIEQKIEEVRTAMRTAFAAGRVFDIMKMQHMVRFLNERYRNLLNGARDVHYIDTEFSRQYPFEGSGSLDNFDPQTLACPFDSDYLPPTVAGYGCDLEALGNLNLSDPSTETIRAERDALAAFLEKRNEFLRSSTIQSMGTMTLDILEAMGREVPEAVQQRLSSEDFPQILTREHRRKVGCSLTGDPRREFDAPPLWPEGAAKWERRGPFSLTSDEFSLVRGLYDMLRGWGGRRDDADVLALPTEYPPDTPKRTAAEEREEKSPPITKLVRDYARRYFHTWNIEQAGKETRPVVQAGDTKGQMVELTSSLRGTMKNFYELSSKRERGIRRFAGNFGFFLRRTCVFRPCNLLLDRMLKITFEDTCFPYTSGLYAESSNTRHDVCKREAGVEEWE